MKLNIGCGFLKMSGYTNIDNQSICNPDIVANLEEVWPFDDNSVTEIYAHHVLEHLGETFEKFMFIMKEMYRVSADGARWKVFVPHWQNDMFYHDPTHVRTITPIMFDMFNQNNNLNDLKSKGHQTKLGIFSGIDVELVSYNYIPAEPWNTQLNKKEITIDQMSFIGNNYNNVCHEIQMEINVYKPARYSEDIIKKMITKYTQI
jgi:hypothetical protein